MVLRFVGFLLLECAALPRCAWGLAYADVGDARRHWSAARGRTGRAAVATNPRPSQARRSLWCPVSDHRHNALELHQFRPSARFRADAVQGVELEPAYSRGLGAADGS